MATSERADEPQFAASEVNLLIYHYLKESGFLHTCFALRYEARLDDTPAAHEAIVQPGQLLHYLQRGLLYATAERHVEERAAAEASATANDAAAAPLPTPDPLLPHPDGAATGATPSARLTPPPVAPDAPPKRQDAASQTPRHESPPRPKSEPTPTPADDAEDAARRRKKAKRGNHTPTASRSSTTPTLSAAHAQENDAQLTLLAGHAAEVFVADWNPTVPSLLATGAGDATVRIWDLNTPHDAPAVCKHLPPTHAKNVSTVAWNADGTLLASSSYDGILRLWTPQGDLHLVMSMHQGPIYAVRWNAQGNYLLTGSGDGSAIVWDVGSGRTRQQFALHSDNVLDVQWITGAFGQPHDAPRVTHANASLADALFATCGADNSVHVCKLGEPKPVITLTGHTDEVNALRVDPSQTLLATASDDHTARIWPIQVPGVGAPGTEPARREPLVLTGHTKELYALAWAPTGPHSAHANQPRMLATCSFDHTARLWDADTGTCLRIIEQHEQSVYAVCFSPCARYVATGGMDAKVLVTRITVRLRSVLTDRMARLCTSTTRAVRCSIWRGALRRRPRARPMRRVPCSAWPYPRPTSTWAWSTSRRRCSTCRLSRALVDSFTESRGCSARDTLAAASSVAPHHRTHSDW